MPTIRVLPKTVSDLIAAGEVVERPTSVVKELIENSIDAGASGITVEIKNGGVRFIRVTDDGCGIAPEQVPVAFISHATSKIAEAGDLDRIFTLGFRGEALPSIAAVSRVTVLTRTPEAEEGLRYEIEGGRETAAEAAGCPVGTTVIVRDLFYNTPARLKFLKKDVSEGNYVADAVTRAALSHPEIRFMLIRDEKTVLRTPGNGDLLAAVYAVFGKSVAEALIPCRSESDGVKVEGYVSRPLNCRPNRNMQYWFVNGRGVRLPAGAPALDNAYKNSIMVGKFPMCFLNITVDAAKTDVNVHPAKTEIRFSDDAKIYETVFYAARSALAKGDTAHPEMRLGERDLLKKPEPAVRQLRFTRQTEAPAGENGLPADAGAAETAAPAPVWRPAPRSAPTRPAVKGIDVVYTPPGEPEAPEPPAQPRRDAMFRDSAAGPNAAAETGAEASRRNTGGYPADWFTEEPDVPAAPADSPPPARETEPPAAPGPAPGGDAVAAVPEDALPPDVRLLGEAFHTYLVAECGDRLIVVDKHAAHERILFDRFVAESRERGVNAQMLLTPLPITLSGVEYEAVLRDPELLQRAGYEISDFGGSTVLLRSCPAELSGADAAELVAELAGELARGNLSPEPERLTWLFHSAACRAAVKAGDRLSEAEMLYFIKKLLTQPDVRYCPHGRPVMIELTRSQLEKQFGRIAT